MAKQKKMADWAPDRIERHKKQVADNRLEAIAKKARLAGLNEVRPNAVWKPKERVPRPMYDPEVYPHGAFRRKDDAVEGGYRIIGRKYPYGGPTPGKHAYNYQHSVRYKDGEYDDAKRGFADTWRFTPKTKEKRAYTKAINRGLRVGHGTYSMGRSGHLGPEAGRTRALLGIAEYNQGAALERLGKMDVGLAGTRKAAYNNAKFSERYEKLEADRKHWAGINAGSLRDLPGYAYAKSAGQIARAARPATFEQIESRKHFAAIQKAKAIALKGERDIARANRLQAVHNARMANPRSKMRRAMLARGEAYA